MSFLNVRTIPTLHQPDLSNRKCQRALALSSNQNDANLGRKADKMSNYLRDLAQTFQDLKEHLPSRVAENKENSSSGLNASPTGPRSAGKKQNENSQLESLTVQSLKQQLEEVLETFTEIQKALDHKAPDQKATDQKAPVQKASTLPVYTITFGDIDCPAEKSPITPSKNDHSLGHLEAPEDFSESTKGHRGSVGMGSRSLSQLSRNPSKFENTLSLMQDRSISGLMDNKADTTQEAKENHFNDISPIIREKGTSLFSKERQADGPSTSTSEVKKIHGRGKKDGAMLDVSPLMPKEEAGSWLNNAQGESWLNNAQADIRADKDISTDYSIELRDEDVRQGLGDLPPGPNEMILAGLDKSEDPAI